MTTEKEIRLGHYSVIEEVGRGGMGIVYKAQDLKLNRVVALKVMIGENAQSSAVQRFIREAKTIAKLNHPNIINVLDVGWEGNYYFFAMDFIEGGSVEDAINDKKITYNNALEIMVVIAQAMDFAHKHGVIHRDLKPANIMLNSKKKPIIMDFGVALSLDESVQLSRSGMMVGTLGYMSPEQLEGKRGRIDRRSDVYSLGAIMYKMLTGRNAFFGTSAQIINKIRIEEPIPITKIKSNIPKDLQYVCSKAMAKNKKYRYDNANELAKDIQLVQNGQKVRRKDSIFMQSSVIQGIIKRKVNLPLYGLWLLVAMIGFGAGSIFSPAQDMPQSWSSHAWSACWNGYFVDFTHNAWRTMTSEQQSACANSYQTWYSFKMNIPQEITHSKTNIDMVLIPPGKFMMGSPKEEKGHKENEVLRPVTIYAPYYIAKYEVSVAQWTKYFKTDIKKVLHPIRRINWQQANNFCIKSGLSLPRESQWEYACRAGSITAFFNGEIPEKKSKSVSRVTNIQDKNSWGCCNMQQNVREWCIDAALISSKIEIVNMSNYFKLKKSGHIVRGGSWGAKVEDYRSAARRSFSQPLPNIGFRPVFSLTYLMNKIPELPASVPVANN
ncbi:bifunctional serine/threonine-protein kinase/formylglycine-generating enzyme family protein [Candidatus Uabimicrobium sp. HlEnr_7]|uniref:bifunctional serine/threonine-protein kinase/formylglycine-generating enzyme family protein n=1 Tax=Candidatus Uabimicrobium helgolandensis TaxID=3095367 RepID=UPI0035581445